MISSRQHRAINYLEGQVTEQIPIIWMASITQYAQLSLIPKRSQASSNQNGNSLKQKARKHTFFEADPAGKLNSKTRTQQFENLLI